MNLTQEDQLKSRCTMKMNAFGFDLNATRIVYDWYPNDYRHLELLHIESSKYRGMLHHLGARGLDWRVLL